MLQAAKCKGHMQGLVPRLVPGDLAGDDMIPFVNNDPKSIRTVKLLPYCFEAMSGLKINYKKSEVFGVGLDAEEHSLLANQFNCQVGSFPMKYLGIPMSPKKILLEGFQDVVTKVEKKLESWQSGNLSFGGRKVLIDSCLITGLLT